MGVTFRTLKEQSKMPMHVLKERTWLDAKGKATTDEAAAATLLGIEGDEITQEQAHAAGLRKTAPDEAEAAEAKMLFYNAEGKQVKAGDPSATYQFLDNDPTRPDSPENKAHAEAQAEREKIEPGPSALSAGDEEFDTSATNYGDLKKAHLVAIAESRGVEVTDGQNREHYIAALTAADKA